MDTRCCSKNAAARKKRFHSFEIFRCIGQVNLLIRRISLIKEQGSHIFEELCQDLGDIFSIVHELIEEIQGSRQIAAANFLYQGPHRIAPGNTKDLPHRFSCHGISHDTALIQKTVALVKNVASGQAAFLVDGLQLIVAILLMVLGVMVAYSCIRKLFGAGKNSEKEAA